jgi:hypothetical protein
MGAGRLYLWGGADTLNQPLAEDAMWIFDIGTIQGRFMG